MSTKPGNHELQNKWPARGLNRELQTLRLAMEQSFDGINIVDLQGVILYANPASEAMYGYRHGELAGKHVSELNIDPHKSEDQIIPAVIAKGSWSGEIIQKKKDGSLFTAHVSASIVIKGNETIGMLGIIRDVSNKKQAEEALRLSETRYRMLHETLRDAFVQVTMEGRILEFNDHYCQLLGYTPEELNALTYQDVTPQQWHAFEARILSEQVMPRGYSDVYEKEYRRKDGTIIPVELRTILSRDGNGRPSTMWAIIRDISERKRAEMSLRESEQIYRNLFENNHSTLLLIDAQDGRITNANAAACHYYGYSLEQITKLHITDINTLPAKQIFAKLKSTMESSGQHLFYRHRLASGQIRDVEVFSGPIVFGGKELLYSIVHDITDRIKAEHALRRLNATLEQQVVERTELAEARAKQLQALAVELIEAEERERRQFAHLLHDDLQQLLAAAKLQVQALAVTSSEPMLSNVERLLEESIAKSRRLSHELSPAILQAGLIAILKWLARHMNEHFGLEVELEVNTDLLLERTPQKVFLFRAVQELLFNIVKHSGVSSAIVEVTSSEESITVRVCDNGRGFDPEILEKRTSNVGFGLLTIKERASYIGGVLTIASAPERGCQFTLTVPNAAADGGKAEEVSELIAEESETPEVHVIVPPESGTRVLVVDDHNVMRHGLIKLIREKPALQVVGEASTGREAIEKARKLQPNVIVMDISMPEMDGIEATRHIKAEMPHVRVIGLTMHDDEHLISSMQQSGAEVTLSKTTSQAELVRAIHGNK